MVQVAWAVLSRAVTFFLWLSVDRPFLFLLLSPTLPHSLLPSSSPLPSSKTPGKPEQTMATRVVTTTNHSSALTALARLFARTFTRTNAYKAFGAYLLFILIKYRNTALGVRPRPDIDGPRGLPLLGNLIDFLKRPRTQNYQHQMNNHEIKFGSHYTVSLPGVGRIINITDPEMLDHVLRVNFWAYEKGSYLRNTLAPMVGQGVYLV